MHVLIADTHSMVRKASFDAVCHDKIDLHITNL